MTRADREQVAQLATAPPNTARTIAELRTQLRAATAELEAARAELASLQEQLGHALSELEATRAELATTTAQLQQARRAARWEGKRQRIRMLTAGR